MEEKKQSQRQQQPQQIQFDEFKPKKKKKKSMSQKTSRKIFFILVIAVCFMYSWVQGYAKVDGKNFEEFVQSSKEV